MMMMMMEYFYIAFRRRCARYTQWPIPAHAAEYRYRNLFTIIGALPVVFDDDYVIYAEARLTMPIIYRF